MSCCFFPPGAVYEDYRKKWVPGFTVGPLHNTKWRYISSLLDFGSTKQEVTYPDAILTFLTLFIYFIFLDYQLRTNV